MEEASTQSFDWGIDLADALVEGGHWDSDLWPTLLRVWSRRLDESKHRAVLDRIGNRELYSRHTRPVADLIYELVKNGGMPYAARLLPEANQLAVALWDCLDADEQLFQGDDWLIKAINHPAGRLTEFWVQSLSLWREQQDPKPDALGDDYSAVFSGILGDETVAGRLAKAVLAQHLGFLLAVDEDWAKSHLLPLFGSPESRWLSSRLARSSVWDAQASGSQRTWKMR